MQTVSQVDNLHEMSKSVFCENKKNNINLSSAESAQRVVMVKPGVVYLFQVKLEMCQYDTDAPAQGPWTSTLQKWNWKRDIKVP